MKNSFSSSYTQKTHIWILIFPWFYIWLQINQEFCINNPILNNQNSKNSNNKKYTISNKVKNKAGEVDHGVHHRVNHGVSQPSPRPDPRLDHGAWRSVSRESPDISRISAECIAYHEVQGQWQGSGSGLSWALRRVRFVSWRSKGHTRIQIELISNLISNLNRT